MKNKATFLKLSKLKCLFRPLYTCTWTNLQVTYFGQTRGWSESTFILTNESLNKITRFIQCRPITLLKTEDIHQTYTTTYQTGVSIKSVPDYKYSVTRKD